jgi:uncharacterized protein YybS (DUF2232 family)
MNDLSAAGMMVFSALVMVLLINRVIRTGLRKGYSPANCILEGALTFLAGVTAGLILAGFFFDLNILSLWKREFLISLDASLAFYRQGGWDEKELQRAVRLIRILFIDAIYGWIIIFAFLFSGMSYFIQKRRVPQWPGAKIPVRPFIRWTAPEKFIWLFLGGLALFLWGSWHPGILRQVGLNILLVAGHIYLAIGLAVLTFFLDMKKKPPYFKFLAVLIMFFFPVLFIFMTLIGVCDTWWDWRKIKTEDQRL